MGWARHQAHGPKVCVFEGRFSRTPITCREEAPTSKSNTLWCIPTNKSRLSVGCRVLNGRVCHTYHETCRCSSGTLQRYVASYNKCERWGSHTRFVHFARVLKSYWASWKLLTTWFVILHSEFHPKNSSTPAGFTLDILQQLRAPSPQSRHTHCCRSPSLWHLLLSQMNVSMELVSWSVRLKLWGARTILKASQAKWPILELGDSQTNEQWFPVQLALSNFP